MSAGDASGGGDTSIVEPTGGDDSGAASAEAGDAAAGPSTFGSSDAAFGPDAIPPFVDPYSGASGCDGGVTSRGCGLMMPLTGGLSLTLYAPAGGAGCNWGSGTSFGATVYGDGYATSVLLEPASPIAAGQTGSQPVSVWITRIAPDGGSAEWVTEPSACTVDLTSDVCSPASGFTDRYLVSGTGSCSGTATGAGGPLSIGSFYVEGQLDQAN
jgi:hypothetical protein